MRCSDGVIRGRCLIKEMYVIERKRDGELRRGIGGEGRVRFEAFALVSSCARI